MVSPNNASTSDCWRPIPSFQAVMDVHIWKFSHIA